MILRLLHALFNRKHDVIRQQRHVPDEIDQDADKWQERRASYHRRSLVGLTAAVGVAIPASVQDVGTSPSVRLPDASTGVTLKTIVADAFVLRAYGFVGDGGSHPLSDYFSNLAAAQAVYPHAKALTDEVDWAAVQGIIDAAEAKHNPGLTITFPACLANFNRSIRTGAVAVYVRGVGRNHTRLQFGRVGSDFWQHGTDVMDGCHAALHMQDLSFWTTVSGCGYALNVNQHTDSGDFVLRNISFDAYKGRWCGYGYFWNTGNCYFENVVADGGISQPGDEWMEGTQVGFHWVSPDSSHRAFVLTFINCNINAIRNAFLFEVTGQPGNSGSIEGVVFFVCNGATNVDYWCKLLVPASKAVWTPPYWVFESCNFGSPIGAIYADSWSDVHIIGGYWASYKFPTAASKLRVEHSPYIHLGNVHGAWIERNDFPAGPGARATYLVSMDRGAENVWIERNVFNVQAGGVVTDGAVLIPSDTSGIRELHNRYLRWPMVVPRVDFRGRGNGNVAAGLVAAYFAQTVSANGNHAQIFPSVDTETGLITVRGAASGTTDNIGNITVPIPAGLLGSVVNFCSCAVAYDPDGPTYEAHTTGFSATSVTAKVRDLAAGGVQTPKGKRMTFNFLLLGV